MVWNICDVVVDDDVIVAVAVGVFMFPTLLNDVIL